MIGLLVAFEVAYAHSIQDEGVNALQLRLSPSELLETDLLSMFAGDEDNLCICCFLRGDVFLPQRLEESS